MAATVISPIELVRTRMQSISHEHQTFSIILKDVIQMIQKNGCASLWRGLLPTLWRDVPFSGKPLLKPHLSQRLLCIILCSFLTMSLAIYWLGYEETKKALSVYYGAQLSRRPSLQKYTISNDFILSFSSGFISGMVSLFSRSLFHPFALEICVAKSMNKSAVNRLLHL